MTTQLVISFPPIHYVDDPWAQRVQWAYRPLTLSVHVPRDVTVTMSFSTYPASAARIDKEISKAADRWQRHALVRPVEPTKRGLRGWLKKGVALVVTVIGFIWWTVRWTKRLIRDFVEDVFMTIIEIFTGISREDVAQRIIEWAARMGWPFPRSALERAMPRLA